MSQESRSIDVFGPNLLLESGGAVGVAGNLAYQLCSVNDSGFRYSQGLYGSGLSAINAEGTLQIEAGIKNGATAVSFIAVAHKGDMALNATEGWVRMKGQDVVIEAQNELILQANKIRIGNQDMDKTEYIRMNAKEIHMGSPRSGNEDLEGSFFLLNPNLSGIALWNLM